MVVSKDSPPNSTSSILHQFIMSNSINSNQSQLDNTTTTNQHFDPQFLGDRMSRAFNFINNTSHHQLSDECDLTNDGRRLMDLLGTSNERLSLSLSSVPTLNSSLVSPEGYFNATFAPSGPSMNQACSNTYGNESIVHVIRNSKYLKAAQSILEEMVCVGSDEIHMSNQKNVEKLSRNSRKGSFGQCSELKAEFSHGEMLNDSNSITLLKLIALLEEVERRYEEYYQHLEELVTSFEVIAGLGTGKSYTALALQAMSKHFCNLRNAILSQIRVAKQNISQDAPKITSRLAQLSLLDRNRMSLQKLGIMQNHCQAWRPIRGLPETSVTILRAWLFEHFLHPYPSDPEKLMLASQTGLSKNQVSNWFINARVRLWKPMIEEMYKEELGDESNESELLLTNSSTSREGVGDSAEDLN